MTTMLTSDWPQPRATLADTPVFLPVKSPTVPFRLVVYELVEDVQVIIAQLATMSSQARWRYQARSHLEHIFW